VRKFRESGQTATEFAKEKKLNYSTFYGWVEKETTAEVKANEAKRKATETIRLFEAGMTVERITGILRIARVTATKILIDAKKIEAKPTHVFVDPDGQSRQQRIEILRAMCRDKLTRPMAAAKFGIKLATIKSWVKEAVFYGQIRQVVDLRTLNEIATILRRQPEVEVCIKEGDTSVSQETEQNTLDELQKLVANDGLLIWQFPESGGMVVRLKRYEELNDDDDDEQEGGDGE
jgi:transposase